ncbi:hypothetical protein V8C37DRAFT_388363 [Trichoderma ceciliae]
MNRRLEPLERIGFYSHANVATLTAKNSHPPPKVEVQWSKVTQLEEVERDTGSGQGTYNVEPRHGQRCGPSLTLSKSIEYLGTRYGVDQTSSREDGAARRGGGGGVGSGILEDGSTRCECDGRRVFSFFFSLLVVVMISWACHGCRAELPGVTNK